MFGLRALPPVVVTALVLSGIALGPASAQVPTPKVSLRSSADAVVFGQRVTLKGRIRPPLAGQRVNIISNGRVVAGDTTDQRGRYSVRLKPARNKAVRAQWATAVSKKERIRVEPRVSVRLGKVRLFRKSEITGRVIPSPGGRVEVKLATRGGALSTERVDVRENGTFRTDVRVMSTSALQARAIYNPEGLARGGDRSAYKRAPTPYLSEGARGSAVRVVEKRLMSLGYRLSGVDRSYDHTTRDAAIAFQKVQGLPRVGDVDADTWHALTRPERPQPVSKDGFHFEIDQTKQVLYIVDGGRIRTIVHTSTGANGATYDGVWTVHRELEGYSPGRLYYPSYFHGARAVHGWPDVPTYPASHGCARVPMWIAEWLNAKAYVGMEVRVYHS